MGADWRQAALAALAAESEAMSRPARPSRRALVARPSGPGARLRRALGSHIRVAIGRLRGFVLRRPLLERWARWAWALLDARETRRLAYGTHGFSQALAAEHAALRARVEREARRFGEEVRRLDGSLGEQERRLEAARAAAETRLSAELSALRHDLAMTNAALRRLETPAAFAVARPAPATDRPEPRPSGPPPHWDRRLLAMTEESRGDRAEIARRLSVHLPLVEDIVRPRPNLPVLDLGCGRGEWLELLRERNIPAKGVDMSQAAIDVCRALGLDAEHGDALDVLAACPDGSLAAVTLFHLIEHLSPDQHCRLFDEAARALAPGGLLLMETPNGENFSVSGRSFWFDPTHRVLHTPASLLRWFTAAGLTGIDFRRLHPYPETEFFPPGPIGDRLNAWFHGGQDFAIWGRTREEGTEAWHSEALAPVAAETTPHAVAPPSGMASISAARTDGAA